MFQLRSFSSFNKCAWFQKGRSRVKWHHKTCLFTFCKLTSFALRSVKTEQLVCRFLPRKSSEFALNVRISLISWMAVFDYEHKASFLDDHLQSPAFEKPTCCNCFSLRPPLFLIKIFSFFSWEINKSTHFWPILQLCLAAGIYSKSTCSLVGGVIISSEVVFCNHRNLMMTPFCPSGCQHGVSLFAVNFKFIRLCIEVEKQTFYLQTRKVVALE